MKSRHDEFGAVRKRQHARQVGGCMARGRPLFPKWMLAAVGAAVSDWLGSPEEEEPCVRRWP